MGSPTNTEVHVDAILTNMSLAYRQRAENFVADRVFPLLNVAKQSDKYFTYDRAAFYRTDAAPRAPGTESAGSDYQIANASYQCERIALHKDIPDPIRANADNPINLDREAVEFLELDLAIKREVDFNTNFFTTGAWDSTGTLGQSVWSGSTSTPIEDVRTSKRTVLGLTGFEPNTLVLGVKVFDVLMDHPDIVARLDRGQTPVGPALADTAALASIFGVDRVLVSRAVKNTAVEGSSAGSYSFIAGEKKAGLFYVTSPGVMSPMAGITFVWNNSAAGVRSFRMPEAVESDRIENQMWYDQKVIASPLGLMWSSASA